MLSRARSLVPDSYHFLRTSSVQLWPYKIFQSKFQKIEQMEHISKVFPNYSMEHFVCSFSNPAESFSLKVWEFFAQKPKTFRYFLLKIFQFVPLIASNVFLKTLSKIFCQIPKFFRTLIDVFFNLIFAGVFSENFLTYIVSNFYFFSVPKRVFMLWFFCRSLTRQLTTCGNYSRKIKIVFYCLKILVCQKCFKQKSF